MYKPITVIVLLFLSWISLTAETGFARLQYTGGGDWYNDPEVLPNLAKYVNRNLGTTFPTEQAIVNAADARLFEYPWLYLTGHGNILFSQREVDNLRNWLLRGGFLYADDDYGMDTAFRREIKRILPEYEMLLLDPGYTLFTCLYDFSNGLPKIHQHDGKKPEAYGIFDENGRLMVLYTYESNISDGWADPETHKDPPEIRETALKFGVNMVFHLIVGTIR